MVIFLNYKGTDPLIIIIRVGFYGYKDIRTMQSKSIQNCIWWRTITLWTFMPVCQCKLVNLTIHRAHKTWLTESMTLSHNMILILGHLLLRGVLHIMESHRWGAHATWTFTCLININESYPSCGFATFQKETWKKGNKEIILKEKICGKRRRKYVKKNKTFFCSMQKRI